MLPEGIDSSPYSWLSLANEAHTAAVRVCCIAAPNTSSQGFSVPTFSVLGEKGQYAPRAKVKGKGQGKDSTEDRHVKTLPPLSHGPLCFSFLLWHSEEMLLCLFHLLELSSPL